MVSGGNLLDISSTNMDLARPAWAHMGLRPGSSACRALVEPLSAGRVCCSSLNYGICYTLNRECIPFLV